MADDLNDRVARLADRRRAAPATATDTSWAHPPTAPPTPARARPASPRRHPAARARVAALGLSLASTAGLTTVFAFTGGTRPQALTAASIRPQETATVPATSRTTAPPQPVSKTVDGAVFHNRWGDVQVEATFGPDGSLRAVTALQVPDHRDRSIRINDAAVPRLNAEALSVQSASVDTVSGATYTTDDYRRSLQSAIDAARAARVTQLD